VTDGLEDHQSEYRTPLNMLLYLSVQHVWLAVNTLQFHHTLPPQYSSTVVHADERKPEVPEQQLAACKSGHAPPITMHACAYPNLELCKHSSAFCALDNSCPGSVQNRPLYITRSEYQTTTRPAWQAACSSESQQKNPCSISTTLLKTACPVAWWY
jgi:hypothetical protein